LTVKGDDGKELTLEDLAEGKKVLLIDFGHRGADRAARRFPMSRNSMNFTRTRALKW
jgi:hypothetical protein